MHTLASILKNGNMIKLLFILIIFLPELLLGQTEKQNKDTGEIKIRGNYIEFIDGKPKNELKNNAIDNKDSLAINSKNKIFTPSNNDTTIYSSVEKPAEFPINSDEGLMKFIIDNFRYPTTGADCFGKVIISFVIEKDSTLTNFSIMKGLCEEYDNAVLNCMKKMPKWKPAQINGIIVRSRKMLPLNIDLK